jgi:hypothetical protein
MSNDDFVGRKRRNRIIGTIVTAAVIGAVTYLIFGYLLRTEDPRRRKGAIGEVLESVGEIQVVRSFKNMPSEPGMIVMSGDFFRTKDGGRATVKYLDDSTEVTIGASSNLVFNAIDNGKRMNLGKGVIDVTAPDQPPEKPLIIVTHSAETMVLRGGAFRFSFIGLDATLEVQSGKIRFRRYTDGKIIELVAGQSHTFKPAGPEKIEFEM